MEKKEFDVAQGLKECELDYMPSFVYVIPSGANGPMSARSIDEMIGASLFFLDSRKEQISVGGNAMYRIDPLNIPLLKAHLNNIMPERHRLHNRFTGWIVPLEESGVDSLDMLELMQIRNIMFWESLIIKKQVGPLAYSMLEHKNMLIRIDEVKTKIDKSLADGDYLMGEPVPDNILDIIKALMKVIDRYRGISSDDIITGILKDKIVKMMNELECVDNQQNQLFQLLVDLDRKKQHDTMVMRKELKSFLESISSTDK